MNTPVSFLIGSESFPITIPHYLGAEISTNIICCDFDDHSFFLRDKQSLAQ